MKTSPKRIALWLLRAAPVLICAPANVAWYAGIGAGNSENLDYDCIGCGPIANVDDSGGAIKLFGGVRWHRCFATQIGFAQLARSL